MMNSKFNAKEAISLVLVITIAHSLLSLPKNLLEDQKSAVILNIAYVSVIAIALAYLIYRLMKGFAGKDIIDISEFLGGKFLKYLLGTIFISYLIFTGSILLRNFCESIKIVYFPNTKVTFILTMFIAAVILVCCLDFKSNVKTTYIIIPVVSLSMIFLFISNLKNFSTDRMFPILGDGVTNTFVTGIGNLYAFGGFLLLYLLPPNLKEPKKFKKVAITSIVLSAIYLLITISIILFMFAYFVNIDEILPLFSAARYIEFGSFFQRLESVFLLIWFIIFACYISIILIFSVEIFKKMTNLKDTKPIAPFFALLLLGVSLIPKNYAVTSFLEASIYPYLNFGLNFVLLISMLILANIKLKKTKAGG